ncbi:MAG: hypothetical protein KA175_12025 [Flavobacteriales bacterium]|nr:hypothetical protein [Flavobacteriales bacterium]MBP6698340.1 hypothetical protein [Flavobacteriales bacterium]
MSVRAITGVLALWVIPTFAQGDFRPALDALDDVGYAVVPSKYCKTEHISAGYGCLTQPQNDHWVKRWQRMAADEHTRFPISDTLDTKKILRIESFDIRGKQEMSRDLYGRAKVIRWSLSSEQAAIQMEKQFGGLGFNQKEELHKAPWSYWRVGDKMYFILTGGTFMEGELPKLREVLLKSTTHEG